MTALVFFFSPRTPLMLAVAYGHVDAVSLLLEKEASVDAADLLGCTALHRGVIKFLYSFIICFAVSTIHLQVQGYLNPENTVNDWKQDHK